METIAAHRTIYGPNKYAALHLMYSKVFRHNDQRASFRYVTLGGTELRDFQSLYFIDEIVGASTVSLEADAVRFRDAEKTANALRLRGKQIDIREGDIFDFRRTNDDPHLFFVDLEGTCALGDFYKQFANLFLSSTLKENDRLLITSYLGRNIGWNKLFAHYDAEFRMLEMSRTEQKRDCYRRAHPSFTLFRALKEADLLNELALNCFGCVEYRDKSPMAIYGYTIGSGTTCFCPFIQNTPYFHISKAFLQ